MIGRMHAMNHAGWPVSWWGACLVLTSFQIAMATDENKTLHTKTEVPISQRIAELDSQVDAVDQQTTAVRAEWLQLQNQAADLKLKLNFLESRLQTFDASRQKYSLEIEELLKESGEWISFSQQIAPIFQNHCLPCHDARNPQGRYNMAHYAAIMSDGESGSPIVGGLAEESYLFQMISDGSMPKDAPALDGQQMELVRKWIDQGARLDANTLADTPLFRLAPRRPHPAAPERYPVPLPVSAIALSPGNDLLASAGYHEVLLWSVPDGQLQRRIGNVAERVHGLAFHPDGRQLAVATGTPGRVGELKLLDVTSGNLLADLWVNHDSVLCLAFSPDGHHLACGDTTGSVVVFSLKDVPKQLWLAEDHSDWVHTVAWSSDGMRIVTASRDKTCKLFDSRTGVLQRTYSGHQAGVTAAVFSQDGQHVVSAGLEPSLRIWRSDTGTQVHELKEVGQEITSLLLLDTAQLLVSSDDNQLREVNLHQGRLVKSHTIPTDLNLCAAALSPRRKVAIGNYNGRISLIDLQEPETPHEPTSKTWLAQPARDSP